MALYQKILTEHLGANLHDYKTVDSTNTVAKAMEVWHHGMVVVAATQTAGRGTYGRSFYSAAGRGIYMTLLLDTGAWQFKDLNLVTIYTAVAVAEAVAAVTGIELDLKGVNDLFLNRRKVGGILTELDLQAQKLVIGIGINLTGNIANFPHDIQNSASSLGLNEPVDEQAAAIVLAIYDKMLQVSALTTAETVLTRYKERLFILGQDVEVNRGNEVFVAKVIDVTIDGKLVISKNGEMQQLSVGEVRLKI